MSSKKNESENTVEATFIGKLEAAKKPSVTIKKVDLPPIVVLPPPGGDDIVNALARALVDHPPLKKDGPLTEVLRGISNVDLLTMGFPSSLPDYMRRDPRASPKEEQERFFGQRNMVRVRTHIEPVFGRNMTPPLLELFKDPNISFDATNLPVESIDWHADIPGIQIQVSMRVQERDVPFKASSMLSPVEYVRYRDIRAGREKLDLMEVTRKVIKAAFDHEVDECLYDGTNRTFDPHRY